MSAPILVTGASGFVGRGVVAALAAAGTPAVKLLTRSPAKLELPSTRPASWQVIAGDPADPRLAAELAGVHTVIHLAARTGPGSQAEHLRANRDATGSLAERARAAGVRRMLFTSSVAAGFADQRHYHYARAKAEAEAIVRASGLEALIVRPTMVFGPGSPPLANLRKLALLPIPIVLGPGIDLQPIHRDDLAESLVAALGIDRWPAEPVEIGGPLVIGLGELVGRLRRQAGKPPRTPWHLPLAPIRTALALVEPLIGPLLPITAGQLAAFANPVVARPSPFLDRLPAPRAGLDAMLAE